MKSEQDRILARVRKLLALANDAGATEGERDNAIRMAHATLAKYNLDIAQVESQGGKIEDEERIEKGDVFYGRPWARDVCSSVAELFFCQYLFISATRAKGTVHFFYGRKSNAVTATEIAKFLVTSIIRESNKRQRELLENHRWKRSFCTGAAIRIRQRVQQILRESQSADTFLNSKALILFNLYQEEKSANAAFVEERLGRKPKSKGGGSRDFVGDGIAAGAEFGDTVNLNRQVAGATAKPVLSLEHSK